MVIRMTSKHQVTIPKRICTAFDLKKGDVFEVHEEGHRIVMVPQEVIFEPKYPKADLEAAERALQKENRREEIRFSSPAQMVNFFKKRKKK